MLWDISRTMTRKEGGARQYPARSQGRKRISRVANLVAGLVYGIRHLIG